MKYRLINVTTLKFRFDNKAKPNVEYKLSPRFGKGLCRLSNTIHELHLAFSLHDDEGNLSPYDIDLEIVGKFEITDCDEKEILDFMNLNAVSILFPYLRSILSSLMSSMMISPIILPIVDAMELFKVEK